MTRFIILFCGVFCMTLGACFAKFKSATIKIDGLTCSMCSYGVEKSIQKLKFVKEVKIDLNLNIAKVMFNPHEEVIIKDLIKSVYNAGFSVRSFETNLELEENIELHKCYFMLSGAKYYLLNYQDHLNLKGVVNLKFIDKSFTDSKSFRSYKKIILDISEVKASEANYYFVTI